MNGRWNRTCLSCPAVCLVLALLVVGCDLPGKPDPADRPVLPGAVTSFDRLYATHCAGCHGASGAYGPAPPLNDPLFVTIIPDDDLRHVIQNGRPGTPMPAFAKRARRGAHVPADRTSCQGDQTEVEGGRRHFPIRLLRMN